MTARRIAVILALLVASLATMGAGWLSGPRFGAGVRGFSQPPSVARVSVGVGTNPLSQWLWAEWKNGDWVDSGSGRAERWYDSSGNGHDLIQPSGSIQPKIDANGFLTADTDTATAKQMYTSQNFSCGSSDGYTFVMKHSYRGYGLGGNYQGTFHQFYGWVSGSYMDGQINQFGAKRSSMIYIPIIGWSALTATQTYAFIDHGDGTLDVYQNGASKNSNNGAGTSSINAAFILFGQNENPFRGSIYSAALYTKALSELELAVALSRL